MKLRHRFLWSLMGVMLAFSLILFVLTVRITRIGAGELSRERVRAETDLLAATLGMHPPEDPQAFAVETSRRLDFRVTLLAADGTVLGDSSLDRPGVAKMENHGDRPEVLDAREGAVGESRRVSDTTGVVYVYLARWVDGPGPVAFVRLALPVSRLSDLPVGVGVELLVTILGTLLLLAAVSYLLVRGPFRQIESMHHSASRIAEGVSAEPIPYSGSDELGLLAATINRMKRHLDQRIERLQIENQRTASVISQMREGLLVVDVDRHVLLANQAFRRIFQVDFEPEGHLLAEVIRAPTVIRDLEAVLEQGQETHDAVFQVPHSGRSFETHVTPLRSRESAAVDGALILFFDITRLEALENVRRDFVANVSHELRTPLTSIKAFVETLLEDGFDDRKASREFLGIIRKHTGRMEELVDDLTDLSLIETGAIELQVEELDGHSMVKAIAAQAKHRHPASQVDIQLDLPSPFPIWADPRRLEQVLLNLVDNAVKFSPADSEVTITGETFASSVRLHVRDQGVGIPVESVDKVFHRFYRVDKARSRDVRGTGLGLAIVKHLMRLHGGTVQVESELGRGSTFSLEFPVAPGKT